MQYVAHILALSTISYFVSSDTKYPRFRHMETLFCRLSRFQSRCRVGVLAFGDAQGSEWITQSPKCMDLASPFSEVL